jgi:hypothetical protein
MRPLAGTVSDTYLALPLHRQHHASDMELGDIRFVIPKQNCMHRTRLHHTGTRFIKQFIVDSKSSVKTE